MKCGCNNGGGILPDLDNVSCKETFGQLQKLVIMRTRTAAGVLNKILLSDATDKSVYDALLAATDTTKIVVTPYVQAPSVEPGDARTFGGGNDSLSGAETIIGTNPTTCETKFYDVPQSVVKKLKQFQCQDISAFLIDENGYLAGSKRNINGDDYLVPFPMMSLFVGDLGLGGFESVNSNAFNWKFRPDWSDELYVVKPTELESGSWNPLDELINPSGNAVTIVSASGVTAMTARIGTGSPVAVQQGSYIRVPEGESLTLSSTNPTTGTFQWVLNGTPLSGTSASVTIPASSLTPESTLSVSV